MPESPEPNSDPAGGRVAGRLAKLVRRLTRVDAVERIEQPSQPLSPVGEIVMALYLTITFAALFFGILVLSQWLLTKWIGWQILVTFICIEGGLIYAGSYLWSRILRR